MKRTILYIFLIVLVAAVGLGAYAYMMINTGFKTQKTVYLYIDENKDYNTLLAQIRDSAGVENLSNFDRLAGLMSYKENLRTGRYAVKPGTNIYDLIKILRRGQQTPVRLTFNNIRTKEDFAKRIGDQLMLDGNSLLAAIDNEQTCEELGFDIRTIPAMFIPNTYEFYWDISIDNFLQRMKKEYDKFWTDKRLAKAQEAGLTPLQVSILASIVEEESMYANEYPTVAGLYINRLHRGQPLQADPTVKFAVGDFTLRRILNKHLQTESPYNTYRHAGLPPGPIRIPSIKGIDAVLDYAKHDYLYMCAKEDFSGYHNFAQTHAEHERNANKYRRALNERKIFH